MRRKVDGLVPSEISILEVVTDFYRHGTNDFYGFQIAQAIEERGEKCYLSGYGILYRALERLEKQGFLESWWEDPDVAVEMKRPRRRLYKLTGKTIPAFVKNTTDSASVHLVLGSTII